MASQLAQFSSLSQLEQINNGFKSMDVKFEDLLYATSRSYAGSLIGQDVSFYIETPGGDLEVTTEPVKQIVKDPETGEYRLHTTGYSIGVNDLLSIGTVDVPSTDDSETTE